jgi:hypothetical protein|tara:strand:+ start:13411 stop:13590 length:180 start_codon:yes stop_codon:yes gene_type:complete
MTDQAIYENEDGNYVTVTLDIIFNKREWVKLEAVADAANQDIVDWLQNIIYDMEELRDE